MEIELNLQVWKQLKQYIDSADHSSAAEEFVQALIEHGVDAEEIAKYAVDEEITLALREYVELEEDEFTEDDDEEEFET